jgi:hypothetical protein
MKSSQEALRCCSPGVVDSRHTIRRKFVKFAGLLLLLSTIVSATAFRESHSIGRSHSRSSSHVRSYKESHRTRRATSSGLTRNRYGLEDHPPPSIPSKDSIRARLRGGRAGVAPATWSIMSNRWNAAEPTPRATCNGKQLRRAKPKTKPKVGAANFYVATSG